MYPYSHSSSGKKSKFIPAGPTRKVGGIKSTGKTVSTLVMSLVLVGTDEQYTSGEELRISR
jgi:hypothetical protein